MSAQPFPAVAFIAEPPATAPRRTQEISWPQIIVAAPQMAATGVSAARKSAASRVKAPRSPVSQVSAPGRINMALSPGRTWPTVVSGTMRMPPLVVTGSDVRPTVATR